MLRPQGRKGEVLADLLTDFPEQFEGAPRVFLAAPHFAGSQLEARSTQVIAAWLPVGRNQGRIVLHFEGVDSITLAETLSGLDVLLPTAQRVDLEEDANYVSDLIGCTVFDHANATLGEAVGVVTDVQFATTADGTRRLEEAAPLLAVETPEGAEILIPYVKAFIRNLEPSAKRIDMTLPAGLVEINRAQKHSHNL